MTRETPCSWLCDMDGVLIREGVMVPGADRFVRALRDGGRSFLVLTNNSMYTPRDLSARLATSGLDIPDHALWTSALATARFLDSQRPGGTAFVIGEAGLTTALHDIGYILTDRAPDYVVLGETVPTASLPSPPPSDWWPTGPGSSPPIPTPPGRRRRGCYPHAVRWRR